MSDTYEAAWLPDYKTVCMGSLVECTSANLFTSHYLDRRNWREELNSGAMAYPFFAIFIGAEAEAGEWAPLDGDMLAFEVDLIGVYSSSDPLSSIAGNALPPFDPVKYLLNRANALREGFNAYAGGKFQMFPEARPTIEIAPTGKINVSFLVQGSPSWAFRLCTKVHVGETN